MNKYEQFLQDYRTPHIVGQLTVGMRVYLKSGTWYNILAEEDGKFWGSMGDSCRPYWPGWYWVASGEFYGVGGRIPFYDIDWERTRRGE